MQRREGKQIPSESLTADDKPPLLIERLNSRPRDLDPTKRFAVGIAIHQTLEHERSADRHRVLIIKRTASEEALPNAWELQGGSVESDGETVRHAVARETLEETGQLAQDVLGEIDEMVWQSRRGTNVQLNYIVTAQEGRDLKLNPDEHSAWLWATQAELDGLYMTSEMRIVLKNAFEFASRWL